MKCFKKDALLSFNFILLMLEWGSLHREEWRHRPLQELVTRVCSRWSTHRSSTVAPADHLDLCHLLTFDSNVISKWNGYISTSWINLIGDEVNFYTLTDKLKLYSFIGKMCRRCGSSLLRENVCYRFGTVEFHIIFACYNFCKNRLNWCARSLCISVYYEINEVKKTNPHKPQFISSSPCRNNRIRNSETNIRAGGRWYSQDL